KMLDLAQPVHDVLVVDSVYGDQGGRSSGKVEPVQALLNSFDHVFLADSGRRNREVELVETLPNSVKNLITGECLNFGRGEVLQTLHNGSKNLILGRTFGSLG